MYIDFSGGNDSHLAQVKEFNIKARLLAIDFIKCNVIPQKKNKFVFTIK